MMEYYFDSEFDAIRRYDGCIQCMVSIGIAAVLDGVVQQTFYSLIQPKRFRRLTRVVREMTQLNDAEIRKARTFAEVMDDVECFMSENDDGGPRIVYSFGPDDVRTMKNHAKYEAYRQKLPFQEAIDLQRIISKDITYQGRVVSPTLSLDDLKHMYDVEGEVVHNALNDALDLMRIHQASLSHKVNEAHVKDVWERKEQKRKEVQKRSHDRMVRILKERYGSYDEQMKQITWYPDVMEQLSFLSDQHALADLRIQNQSFMIEESVYPISLSRCHLRWHMKDTPSITLYLQYLNKKAQVEIPLTYRNAGIFNDLWRISGGKRTS